MKRTKIALVTPTTFEAAALKPAIETWQVTGSMRPIVSGVGITKAAAVCKTLENGPGFEWLVLLGWAGGLDPELRIGSRVIADQALLAGKPSLPCHPLTLPETKVGPILTVANALYTREDKRKARLTEALAVEMEAYPLAAWAQEKGIPFIHARVILDTADEELPKLGDALTPDSDLSLGRLLRLFLTRRVSIRETWRLTRRVQATNPRLNQFAYDLLSLLLSGG